MVDAVAEAYSLTGATWERGPGRIYDVLADQVVALVETDWEGRLVLDVGSGRGAASRAIVRAGGRPVAADVAVGMLAGRRIPAASLVGDARALPVAAGRLAGYVAAFCLNHLADPAVALVEAQRVLRPGSPLVASGYAADDDHPVKAATDGAAREHGWTPPPWAEVVKRDATPQLATTHAAREVARSAGLLQARAHHLEVAFPELTAEDLVAWRMGMAQLAPYVAALPSEEQEALRRRALELLGEPPTLLRRIVVLCATV